MSAGCDVPDAGAGGNTFYVDPISGSMANTGSAASPWRTLAEVFSQNEIETMDYTPKPYTASSVLQVKNAGAPVKAGDTIVLRSGNHGAVSIRGYTNSRFIRIVAQSGHTPVLDRLVIVSSARFLFDGLDVSATSIAGGNLLEVADDGFHGPSSNVVIVNSRIYSTLDEGSFSASDWLNVANGMQSNSRCTTFLRNTVRNVRRGIVISGTDTIAESNLVQNFSADGVDVLNSRCTVRNNTILDEYLNEAAGDANHDDGIQSFNLGSGSFDDVIIEGNTIIESTNPTRPFQATMQGIGIFDGAYNRLKVFNNVISVSDYHGIGILGADNSEIVNNTVVGSTTSWVGLFDSKTGHVPVNTVLRNNIAYRIIGGTAADNNITVTNPALHFVQFNFTTKKYDFHLISASTAVLGGNPVQAPLTDIEGRTRGNPPSVGAHEF